MKDFLTFSFQPASKKTKRQTKSIFLYSFNTDISINISSKSHTYRYLPGWRRIKIQIKCNYGTRNIVQTKKNFFLLKIQKITCFLYSLFSFDPNRWLTCERSGNQKIVQSKKLCTYFSLFFSQIYRIHRLSMYKFYSLA